jgi:hypothetical protein
MIGKVSVMIARQYVETAQLPHHLSRVAEQIRLETTEEMKLERVPTVFFVPDAFRKPYKEVFPDLYERVSHGLIEKSRAHDALVEVTYDFVTRWGLSFQQFEDYHLTYLHEICDRTITKENENLEGTARQDAGAEEVPDTMVGLTQRQREVKLNRLADEVLHFVEQEMRSFRTEPSAPGLEQKTS